MRKRTCKQCHKEFGAIGAILHLSTHHKGDKDSMKWLLKDIYDREIYDLWKISLLPFYWFSLVLVAVCLPILKLADYVLDRWWKR